MNLLFAAGSFKKDSKNGASLQTFGPSYFVRALVTFLKGQVVNQFKQQRNKNKLAFSQIFRHK